MLHNNFSAKRLMNVIINTPSTKNENENESLHPFASLEPLHPFASLEPFAPLAPFAPFEPFEHFEHNVNEKQNEMIFD